MKKRKTMTVNEVLTAKRWMRLALPDDVQQLVDIAKWLHKTEHRQAVWLKYQLDLLRVNTWDRKPRRKPRKPKILRPSREKYVNGYRKSPELHSQAYKVRKNKNV